MRVMCRKEDEDGRMNLDMLKRILARKRIDGHKIPRTEKCAENFLQKIKGLDKRASRAADDSWSDCVTSIRTQLRAIIKRY